MVTCKTNLSKIKTSFAEILLEQMKRKEGTLFNNDAFIGSIFIDFRWHVILNNTQVERAIEHIVRVSCRFNSTSLNNISTHDEMDI